MIKTPTEFEMKQVRKQLEESSRLAKIQNKILLKWHTNATSIIKKQIEDRIKRKGPEDWKVKFYESKLKIKSKTIQKIKKLIE